MMLSNPMFDKYPLKTGYLTKLLKTIINQVWTIELNTF